MKKIIFFLIVFTLLLSGCSTQNIKLKKFGIQFWYPEKLFVSEGKQGFYAETGGVIWTFSGEIISYGKLSERFDDWTLSLSARDQIISKLNCEPLEQETLTENYLPVNFAKPNLCNVEKNNDIVVLYAIGFDHPFKSAADINNLIIVFKNQNALIIKNLPLDHRLNMDIIHAEADFDRKHGVTYFPSENFDIISRHIDTLITNKIKNYSPEIKSNFEMLQKIVRSIKVI